MSDCLEVLFVSDSSGKQQTANCFNPNVGTTLMTYRGSCSIKKCLSVIGNDYLISADSTKPILNVWQLNSQEPMHELNMVISGKPSALCTSPNGHYCVAAIMGKIYVWHISSGTLLNVVSKHYQDVNKIVFSDDSGYFVTAGEDGLVLVWKLSDVIAKQCGDTFKLTSSQINPVYNFSHHSLPVTDIYLGSGNMKARLFTVSSDQTCKIYCLSSGELLLSIVFEYILTSVTVNELETELFVGTSSGKIQVFHLDPYPRGIEHHISGDSELSNTFSGHSKAVTCLHISIDGVTLASGGDDEKVLLWNIPSRQLMRSFEMKAPVTNLFFRLASGNIFSEEFKPQLVVSKFEKTSKNDEKGLVVNVWVRRDLKPISLANKFSSLMNEITEVKCPIKYTEDIGPLREEIEKLKDINKQLYQFAMTKILKNPLTIGLNNMNNEHDMEC